MRVLGIDTSLRSTGIGVVQADGNKLSSIEYGTIKTPAGKPVSECLKRLSEGVADIIDRTRPDAVSIEGVFFAKNLKTTLRLGEARGSVIAACKVMDLPVYEYAPRKVKQAVTGNGAASKAQVSKMVVSLLGLDEEPPEDASDALAIAMCHLHNKSGVAELAPKEI